MFKNLPRHFQALASLKTANIIRLTGLLAGSRAPVSAVYAGNGTNLHYLRALLFDTLAQTTHLAAAAPPLLHRRLSRMDLSADILICERPPLWSWLGPSIGELRFPAWVRQVLDLPTSTNTKGWLIDRHLEREAERHIRRHDYRFDLTASSEDLRRFHAEYYTPYTRGRFGAEAVVLDQRSFMRVASGATLARLFTGSRWTAGMLLMRTHTTLRFGWFGSVCTPPAPGASEVLDVLTIRWAAQQGVRHIVLGNSRPSLSNGVVRYKRKFGARFAMSRFPQTTIELRVLHPTESVLRWIVAQQFVCPMGHDFGVYGHAERNGPHAIGLQAISTLDF